MGLPLRQTELDPRSSPVEREIEPGVPTPTVPDSPSSCSTPRTSVAMVASVPR